MAIEYKAIKKKVLGGPDKGKEKYYAVAISTGTTTLEDLSEDIVRESALSGADVRAAAYALMEAIILHLKTGNVVELGDIGSFQITLQSQGEDTEAEVGVKSIKGAKILFRAKKKFEQVLKDLRFKKL